MSKRYIPKIYPYDNKDCNEHIAISHIGNSISVDILKVTDNNRFISMSYSVSKVLYDAINLLKKKLDVSKEEYNVENLMVSSSIVNDIDKEIIDGGDYGF